MEKTAVEWLFNQFQRTGIYPKYSVNNEESNLKQDLIHTLIDHAKAMENNQRLEDFKKGFQSALDSLSGANDLVQNKTFKSE